MFLFGFSALALIISLLIFVSCAALTISLKALLASSTSLCFSFKFFSISYIFFYSLLRFTSISFFFYYSNFICSSLFCFYFISSLRVRWAINFDCLKLFKTWTDSALKLASDSIFSFEISSARIFAYLWIFISFSAYFLAF